MTHRLFKPFLFAVFAGCLIAAPMAARAAASDEHKQHRHDIVQGPHVEGHIAFMHAELGITPEQETLWAHVAAAMRQDVKNLEDAEARTSEESNSGGAVSYLENRAMFAKLRAQGEDRFLKAFRPLYDNLSDEQKAKADELLMPRD